MIKRERESRKREKVRVKDGKRDIPKIERRERYKIERREREFKR